MASMVKVLVSACLLGEKVRYNGAAAAASSAILTQWLDEGRVVPFCPEVAGGLGVPRPAAEIAGGAGESVLAGLASVVTASGADLTSHFRRGAELALAAARANDARVAILKDGSPSCGSGSIHDGTFSGRKRDGQGVTTALLERHGIRVFSEAEFTDAANYLAGLERTTEAEQSTEEISQISSAVSRASARRAR
jgi:uncharacterized protein YbbK (DUF523 family)